MSGSAGNDGTQKSHRNSAKMQATDADSVSIVYLRGERRKIGEDGSPGCIHCTNTLVEI
jgi:hypothetical protein